MNSIIDKWKKYGLLDHAPNERKEHMANAFEYVQNFLYENGLKFNEKLEKINVFIFPILYRICKEVDISNKDIESITNEFYKIMDEIPPVDNTAIDYEVLFVAKYSDSKIEEINNRNNNITNE